MGTQKIGGYAFIIGVIIAIIAGIGAQGFLGGLSAYIPLVLIVLGLIVGALNVTDKETEKFLIAGIGLIAAGTSASTLAIIPGIGVYLGEIVAQIAVFVTPAVILVALKSVYSLASEA
ncbi:MAG TPA: hypothetical protein VFF13_03605 [archaeon]|nr:hypothetical protein [archaeon]